MTPLTFSTVLTVTFFCWSSKAVFVAFVMAFAHPGYLMFGGLHSAFSSFGATFLLVCSFFRLEGASRSQGAAFQECPLLSSFYVGVFSVGWWVVMKGLVSSDWLVCCPVSQSACSQTHFPNSPFPHPP